MTGAARLGMRQRTQTSAQCRRCAHRRACIVLCRARLPCVRAVQAVRAVQVLPPWMRCCSVAGRPRCCVVSSAVSFKLFQRPCGSSVVELQGGRCNLRASRGVLIDSPRKCSYTIRIFEIFEEKNIEQTAPQPPSDA
jgi:hypothetical protein